jgi:hypothetical protein
VAKYEVNFLDIPYRHVVFTIPSMLWPIIQCNRWIGLNILLRAAAHSIQSYTEEKLHFTPAIMCVVHTFGRDLKFNPHVHLLVSCGGLSKNRQKWIHNGSLHFETLKTTWRYQIITELRAALLTGDIKFDRSLLDKAFTCAKHWYVSVGEKLGSAKKVVRYIGR